jgi:hypothetical protein
MTVREDRMAGSNSARPRRLWAAVIGFGVLLGLALPAVLSAQRERGRDEKKVVKMVVRSMAAQPPKPKPLEGVELLITVENQGPDANERPSALYLDCKPVSGGPCPWKSPIKVSVPPLGVSGRHVARLPAGKFPAGTYRLSPSTGLSRRSPFLLVVGGSPGHPNPGPPGVQPGSLHSVNPGPPNGQPGPPNLALDPAVLTKFTTIQPHASPAEGLRAISLRPGQKLLLDGGMSLVAWRPFSSSEAGIAWDGPGLPRGGALLLVDSSGQIRKRFPQASPVQQDSAKAIWVNVEGQAHLIGKLPAGLRLPAVQRPAKAPQPR